MSSKDEVRSFLMSRRAAVSPAQAGLTEGLGERRVAGMRREEVAMLAGVSLNYTRLERGAIGRASENVLPSATASNAFATLPAYPERPSTGCATTSPPSSSPAARSSKPKPASVTPTPQPPSASTPTRSPSPTKTSPTPSTATLTTSPPTSPTTPTARTHKGDSSSPIQGAGRRRMIRWSHRSRCPRGTGSVRAEP